MAKDKNAPENVIFETEEENITYYICQNGNELTEKTLEGDRLSPADKVGSARTQTPVGYLFLEEEVRGYPSFSCSIIITWGRNVNYFA